MTTKPGKFWFTEPRPYSNHEPRLGRENACSPVFIWRHAPLWLILSATIERITHMSSTHVAMCGKSCLTGVPDCPFCLNDHGDCKRFPVLVRSSFGFSNGIGLPFPLASRGFGSNKS